MIDEDLTGVRDLAKEISAANKFDACPSCGAKWKAPKTKRGLTSHQLTPQCTADSTRAQLRNEGWCVTTARGFLYLVCEAAQVTIRREYTTCAKEFSKTVMKQEHWIPKWIVNLIGDDTYRLLNFADNYFSNEEAVPLFGEFIRQLNADHDKRSAVFAAKRLSGMRAIQTMVFTNKIRASRLRRKAAELLAQSMQMEQQADELDPPEVEANAAQAS